MGVKKGVDGLEEAVKEAASHKYFNYALLAMGGVTLLVDDGSLREVANEIMDTQEWDEVEKGVDGLESQCLLSLYSICVFIILLLQIAAIVFINVDDANISFIKEKISNEAAKIDIEDPEKLTPGSKFVQNLFFGISAGLSAIILFFTITLCCRARREERVQGYVEAIQA